MAKPALKVEIDFIGVPTATYQDVQLGTDGVVAFWRMNSVSSPLDDTRGAYDGVIEGTPTTTPGPHTLDTDVGLDFDGTSDAAFVASAAGLETKDPMSVEFWMRVPSIPGATRDIIAKRGAWLVQLNSAGRLVVTLKDDNSTASATGTGALVPGAWYHVAAVYTGAAIQLYVDAALEGTTAYAGGMGFEGAPILFAAAQSAASPTWVSRTIAVTGGAGTATGAKPASLADGDVLIAHMSFEGTPSVTATPAGWTQFASAATTGGLAPRSDRLFMKVITNAAGEPANYSWTLSGATSTALAIHRWTGVDNTAPIQQMYTAWSVTTTVGVGQHTPSSDRNMVAVFAAKHEGSVVVNAPSPAGSTNRSNDASGTTATIRLDTYTQTTAAQQTVSQTSGGTTGAFTQFYVVLNGAGRIFTPVALKDVSYWGRALTAMEVLQHRAQRRAGAGTWVDISADVRAARTTGGRQYELDRMEAATAGVRLRDLKRRYDPGNEASPLWPNVKPMKRIRISLVHLGTTYRVFTGYVERWPPQHRGPHVQEIALTAVDGFDALAQADVSGLIDTTFSGTQIGAVLTKALWPSGLRAIDAGQYVMRGEDELSGKALAIIQEIADSELGLFFMDASGNATFHDRARRGSNVRSTTSQARLIDTAGGTVYQDLDPSYDRDKITNEWEVSPHSDVVGGTPQTVRDPDSVAEFFLRSKPRQTRLASNADALAQGNQLLNETAQPNLRFDSLTVIPRNDAEWTAVLGLAVSDRVTVVREPVKTAAGTVYSRDCFIEGISWDLDPSRMAVTFKLSPVSSGDYYNTIVRDGPISYWRMDTVT